MENEEFGYIYIRNHQSYDEHNVYKLGKAENIIDRDSTYITGEFIRGYYEAVFKVFLNDMNLIEKLLQKVFKSLHRKDSGGSEFFDRSILELIEPYFKKNNIYYHKLTSEEISEVNRKCKERNEEFNSSEDTQSIEDILNILNPKPIILDNLIPRKYQEEIITKSLNHFNENDKGLLVLTCGMGKTLLSLWIAQRLKASSILIGVPNNELLKQWKKEIKKIFDNFKIFTIDKDTKLEVLNQILTENTSNIVLITTYHSSNKILSVSRDLCYKFSMKILDECHHLTYINTRDKPDGKKFIDILDIESDKQLSLTATLKVLEDKETDENIISNDNEKIFGEIIERKCLKYAIDENIICDYFVQTFNGNEEYIESLNLNENDKRLAWSSYISLKSILENHSHHLLIYSNSIENSNKIIDYIKLFLDKKFNNAEIFHSSYNSETDNKVGILKEFNDSKYGILSVVYGLGEGWDCPKLDGVVFSENMSSNIRIVQSALRASRKDNSDNYKKAKIILPILHRGIELLEDDNPDLKKVKEIIYQMSLEDETIIQKIQAFKVNTKLNSKNPKPDDPEPDDLVYDPELTGKLKLKTIDRNHLNISYEKAKSILKPKNFRSKEEYEKFCDSDIRFSKEPEIRYKDKGFNYIDYLGIDRDCYDLETCKIKVKDYLETYTELKGDILNYSNKIDFLTSIDSNFPPKDWWIEYYKINDIKEIFPNIISKKQKGLSLII